MSNKQQTAVDFIIDELTSKNLLGIFTYEQYKQVEEIFEKAKEMNKGQIIDACWAGGDDGEQYYKETYGGNK
jgi:hypothetical protein